MPETQSTTPTPPLGDIRDMLRRGYQPVPVLANGKRSLISGWRTLNWGADTTEVERAENDFQAWAEEREHTNLGVLLGEPSGGLVDIDLDHPITRRLQDYFLPPTRARSGTTRRPSSHYWYIVEPGTLQATRFYKMPSGGEPGTEMIVEYRGTGAYTVIPPSTHPSGDAYVWSGQPWGGETGPAVVDGRTLAVQTALLGFCSLLVEHWPGEGGRHQAFLALAGGLLRVGEGVHPYWERNAGVVIEAIAEATEDEDGGRQRVKETLDSTIRRLAEGKPAAGFGKLAEIMGEPAVKQAQVILADIEALAGLPPRTSGSFSVEGARTALQDAEHETKTEGEKLSAQQRHERFEQKLREAVKAGDLERAETLTVEEEEAESAEAYDPLESRVSTWEAVDLEPYITGQVQQVTPTVLERSDGQALLYPGRLNMLYGPSEAAKSWLAMYACVQQLKRGERVTYLDFEDEPVNAINRMKLLGATEWDLRAGFQYVRPEEPLAVMQRTRWGEEKPTDRGTVNATIFEAMLESHDPTLIVADGMTVIYGLHGLDSNDSVQTDVITNWLKSLTRNGRSTVMVVDHTAKNPQRGSLPIGSQHKVAMVQGSLLQTYPVMQPMPGAVGEVELIVLKDRPGQVRAASQKSGEKAQLAAKFIMDSREEGRVAASLEDPDSKPVLSEGEVSLEAERAAAAYEALVEERDLVLAAFEGDLRMELSMSEVADRVQHAIEPGAQNQVIRRIVNHMVEGGFLIRSGRARATKYSLAVVEVEQ